MLLRKNRRKAGIRVLCSKRASNIHTVTVKVKNNPPESAVSEIHASCIRTPSFRARYARRTARDHRMYWCRWFPIERQYLTDLAFGEARTVKACSPCPLANTRSIDDEADLHSMLESFPALDAPQQGIDRCAEHAWIKSCRTAMN